MKNFLKKHKIYIFTLVACILFIIGSFTNVFGSMINYEETDFKTGIVRAKVLNIRKGPGLNYSKISTVKKDEYIRIFAKIGDWYVVQTNQNIIGAAYSKYIDAIYPDSVQTDNPINDNTDSTENNENSNYNQDNNNSEMDNNLSNENLNTENNSNSENTNENSNTENDTHPNTTLTSETIETNSDSLEGFNDDNAINQEISEQTSTTNLSIYEEKVLTLVNNERKNNNLPELCIDDEVENIARTKALDMKKNKYFSHNSPEYGSPFDMLKRFNVTYTSAGENIAGNSNINNAFDAWINSEDHAKNILNPNYNYTGIGVVDSFEYGKILVQLFIQKE